MVGVVRVLVCGGRDYDDSWHVDETLDSLAQVTGLSPITHVITGDAMGADLLAGWWAKRRHRSLIVYEADWATHGKAAGPKRNATMLTDGKPDVVVAFPGGKGTADMVRRARKAGVLVVEVACE